MTKVSYFIDWAIVNLVSCKAAGQVTQWFKKSEHELLEVIADKLQKYNGLLEEDNFNVSPLPKSMIMCGICKQVFEYKKKSKDTHFKLQHSTKYKCAHVSCSKTFISQERLTAHEKIHSKAKTDLHICKTCGKEFLHDSELNNIQVHLLWRRSLCVIHVKKCLRLRLYVTIITSIVGFYW